MRKNSIVDFVLAKKIVAAIMIFCQAAFLLPNGASAQNFTQSDVTLSAVFVGTQNYGRIPLGVTTNVFVPMVRFDLFSDSGVKVMDVIATSSSKNYYSYFSITNLSAGNYHVGAVALNDNLQVVGEAVLQPLVITSNAPVVLDFLSPLGDSVINGIALLSVKSSDPGVAVDYYYQGINDATPKPLKLALQSTTGEYHFNWDTSLLDNGRYVVMAKATKNSANVAIKQIGLNIYNEPKVVEPPIVVNLPATTTPQIIEPAMEIWFLETPTSTLGQRTLMVRSNAAADSVLFIVQGPNQHQVYDGVYSTAGGYHNYSFVWDAQNFPANPYYIRAEANKNGQKTVSDPVSIIKLPTPAIFNPVSTTTRQIVPTSTQVVTTKIDIGSGVVGGVASGTVLLFARTTDNISKIDFLVEIGTTQQLLGQGVYDNVRQYWITRWNTNNFKNGIHNVLAVGFDIQGNKFYSNSSLKINIDNQLVLRQATTTPNIVQVSTTTKEVIAVKPPEKIINQIISTSTIGIVKIIEPIKFPAISSTTIKRPIVQTTPMPEKPIISDLPARLNTSTTKVAVVNEQIINTQPKIIGDQCQQAGITDSGQCELHRLTNIAELTCQEAKLSSKEECIELVRSKFGEPLICQKISAERCNLLFSEVIVNRFVPQKQIDKASQALEGLIGKNIQFNTGKNVENNTTSSSSIFIKETNSLLQMEKTLEGAILPVSPFADNQNTIGVTVLAVANTNANKDESTVRAVLSIDSDSDGLSDDIEKRLGTDSNNIDTDGDGFDDGAEVKSGHNPLGTGMLAGNLFPAERALVNKVVFEQPKGFGMAKPEELMVNKVEITSSSSDKSIKLTGKALPNQFLSIFIYSPLPIIVTVATDQNGNWSYNLDKSLSNGKHEAYVVINNEQGKIESKSAPFSFFVNGARAISQDDLLKADINVYDQTDTMLWWYASAGFILILFIAGLFFLYIRSRKTTLLS